MLGVLCAGKQHISGIAMARKTSVRRSRPTKVARRAAGKDKRARPRGGAKPARADAKPARAVRAAKPAPRKGKWVYVFGGVKAEGRAQMKNLLGGQGANLAEMANLGPPVPRGFTITSAVCTYFY